MRDGLAKSWEAQNCEEDGGLLGVDVLDVVTPTFARGPGVVRLQVEGPRLGASSKGRGSSLAADVVPL